jgi:hypothetical protein
MCQAQRPVGLIEESVRMIHPLRIAKSATRPEASIASRDPCCTPAYSDGDWFVSRDTGLSVPAKTSNQPVVKCSDEGSGDIGFIGGILF